MNYLFFMYDFNLNIWKLLNPLSQIYDVQQLLTMKTQSQRQPQSSCYDGARASFVQKVYTTLSIQLLITALIVFLDIQTQIIINVLQRFPMLIWAMVGVSIISLLALGFSPTLCQTFPKNFILLGIFTISQSILVSSICSIYKPQSVLLAAFATATITLSITVFAVYTKYDFTTWLNSLNAFVFSVFWFVLFIVSFNIFFKTLSFVQNILAIVFSLIYIGYILIDTQLILGGKNKELTLDNYVLGAVLLYVDIISLFLKILKLLGQDKDKKN